MIAEYYDPDATEEWLKSRRARATADNLADVGVRQRYARRVDTEQRKCEQRLREKTPFRPEETIDPPHSTGKVFRADLDRPSNDSSWKGREHR